MGPPGHSPVPGFCLALQQRASEALRTEWPAPECCVLVTGEEETLAQIPGKFRGRLSRLATFNPNESQEGVSVEPPAS